jgi:two-component system, NtrC family, nitrogen regulation sensor histidine kinase NtrY
LIRRIAALERRTKVLVHSSPEITWNLDPDQIEQVLINLIRNAADAALETRGEVSVSWTVENQWVEVAIDDTGYGISNAANLFVPFFTTKPGGTGVGLVLSRQIAEAHRGSLMLENRVPKGCRAILRIGVRPPK